MRAMSEPASRITSSSSENSFGQLWLSRDVAALADWMILVTMLCYAAMFSDSPSVLGNVIAIMLAPRFILRPVATRLVTWRNARLVGMAAQILRVAALVPAFMLQREDGAQPVLIITAVYALAGPFTAAAQRALLGAIVGDGQRYRVRTALTNTWVLTLAVGPAFGYAIYGAAALRGGAAAAIVALLISAVLMFMVRPVAPGPAVPSAADEMSAGFVPLPAGIAASFRDPALSQVAAIQVIVALLAGGVAVLEAAYTTNGLFISIEYFGLLLASQGLGVAVSTVIYRRSGERYSLNAAVATGLALLGGGELGLAISSGLTAGLGFTGMIGLGIGLVIVSMTDISMQIMSSQGNFRLPVIGMGTVIDGAILLSAAVAAPLCLSISPRFALVLTGTLIWVLALYSFGAMPESEEQSRTNGALD